MRPVIEGDPFHFRILDIDKCDVFLSAIRTGRILQFRNRFVFPRVTLRTVHRDVAVSTAHHLLETRNVADVAADFFLMDAMYFILVHLLVRLLIRHMTAQTLLM